MTPTKNTFTEDERIAYECGYRNCCIENGIPFIGIRRSSFLSKSILSFNIEMTEEAADNFISYHADELAKYIIHKLEEGYEKFKRGETLD